MIYKAAGRQIQMLRVQHNMTQKELADKINSSQNYLSDVETGKKKPSLDYYMTIANYFNVSLDHIFVDSLNMKKNIIIDSIVLKTSYMPSEEQKMVLDVVESIERYLKKKKQEG